MEDGGAVFESGKFTGREGEVNDLSDAISTQNTGEGEGDILETILASEKGRKGDNFATVAHDGFDNVGDGGSNAIVGSAFAANDFVGVFAGLLFGPT